MAKENASLPGRAREAADNDVTVLRAAREIFAELGYSDHEAAAYLDDLFIIVHPDDRDTLLEAMMRASLGFGRNLDKPGQPIELAQHVGGDQQDLHGPP